MSEPKQLLSGSLSLREASCTDLWWYQWPKHIYPVFKLLHSFGALHNPCKRCLSPASISAPSHSPQPTIVGHSGHPLLSSPLIDIFALWLKNGPIHPTQSTEWGSTNPPCTCCVLPPNKKAAMLRANSKAVTSLFFHPNPLFLCPW